MLPKRGNCALASVLWLGCSLSAQVPTGKIFGTLYEAMVTDDQILSENWELETSGYTPDPRFNKDYGFYPPITARLGMRFSF